MSVSFFATIKKPAISDRLIFSSALLEVKPHVGPDGRDSEILHFLVSVEAGTRSEVSLALEDSEVSVESRNERGIREVVESAEICLHRQH